MKISESKKEKIKESILSLLYHSPKALFTAFIAREIARDEEFTKTLLEELQKNTLLIPITKNSKGVSYSRRIRWRLSNKAYNAYKQLQKSI